MSAPNAMAADVLELYFQATAHTVSGANLAQNHGTTPATSLYVSLHTADPGETGSQTTNEIAYTNYVRVPVTRNSSEWGVTVADPAEANNTNAITFATCGVTGGTATHFGIGTGSSGAGYLMFSGALSSSLVISNGIQPQFAATQCKTTLD